jgi:hypothetical protein
MTDQPQDTAEEAPAPGAAPAPAPASGPGQETPVPPAAQPQEDQTGRIAELEAELTRLRAAAVTGAKVLLRVLPPHVSFTHGSRTVGTEPTPVPARAAADMTEAAAEAGVTLQQEE